LIDPIRHMKVFDPDKFGNGRVDVIGCGATGSRVVLSLAKLGINNIHVWDFDVIEEHNIANQAFGNDQIGQLKVEAIRDIVSEQTGVNINTHPEKVDGSQTLGEHIFILTDTMESRKEIYEKGIKFKPFIKTVVETRMGSDNGRVYAFSPIMFSQAEAWESTLYSDEEAEVSACGASVTVGPTAEMISGMAVWQFIRYYKWHLEGGEEPENEVIFSLQPIMFITQQF